MDKKLDIEKEKKKIKDLNGNKIEIVSSLLSLQVELPHNSTELTGFICGLDKDGDIAFLNFCKEALDNGVDVFRIAHLMQPVFPKLSTVEIDTLVDILDFFCIKMKGDMAAGLFHSAVEKRAEIEPDFPIKLEQKVLNHNNTDLLGYLVASYLGLAKNDSAEAFKRMYELINDEDSARKSYGLRGIGTIGKQNLNNKDEIVSTLKKYNNKTEPILAANSTYSTFKLVDDIEELKKEASKLSKSEIPEVQYEISSYLRFSGNCEEAWQQEILFNLLPNTESKNKGITDHYDSILYSAVHKNKNVDLVERFFNDWVRARKDEEIVKNKITDTFSMTFSLVSTNQSFVSKLLAKWFNEDEFRFHKSATHFVDYLKLHKVKPTFLDAEYLSEQDYESCLYMIRKILGYVFEFNHSISYICSFFQIKDIDEKLSNLIASVLVEHIGYNYLVKTIEYLENLDCSLFNNKVEGYVKAVVEKLSERLEENKSLEPINELRPEVDTMMKIEAARQKNFSKIMENTPRSSFLDFVTKVKIKEGRNWFSYMHGKYSEVSTMASYSESIELPKADVLDEVGAIIERQGFRAAKRGQK